jgi:translation initiation factor 2B subunit (eIF-2B alpha/beta/delta family)
LVHKTGTRDIAYAAKRNGIPFYSSCETTKFSTEDFLGKRPDIPASLFDLTPAEFVSGYITEEGQLSPTHVEPKIRELQKEIYP